jgi:hypothetical protein
MRMLLVMLLAGCLQRTTGLPGDPGDPAKLPTRCTDDSGCQSGEVCARTDVCLASSDVRAVHVNWTVDGMTASQDTCGSNENLDIQFSASGSGPHPHLGYEPVPCLAGRFTIDKLPLTFNTAGLGIIKLGLIWGNIDASTGEATLDLVF